MSFKMKFEALQPIGYGDYESGLAEGRKQGIEQGKFLGLQQGVSQTNAEVLVLTGTEKTTATQAIAEINATLATNLTAKGVEADATETTDALADKVGDIRNPQDAYSEGYLLGLEEGKALGDTLADFFGKWFDIEIKEITIGSNNITNAQEVVDFLQEATGVTIANIYVTLMDEITANNQFLHTSIGNKNIRFRNGAINDVTGMSRLVDMFLVEGTKYKCVVIKGARTDV